MSKKRKSSASASASAPQPLEISLAETEELLKKIEEKKLEDKDYERIKAFINSFVFIQKLLERQKLSIKRLKNLFFGKTEKSANILPETETDEKEESKEVRVQEQEQEIEVSNHETDGRGDASGDEGPGKKKAKKKGHGMNGASAYKGAEEVYVSLKELKDGQLCPDCEKGKLYKWNKDGIEIRIRGSAPLKACIYKLEKLRCALCGKLYTAQLPRKAGKDKYDAQAGSMIVMLKYGSGFPFYRLDNFQKSLGVPVPASTQWEISTSVFKTAIHPYEEMVRRAAQGQLLHTDDTGVKILSIMKENKQKESAVVEDGAAVFDWDKRKDTYSTGIMSKVGEHVIVLYFSGRKYAGENLDDLLRRRAAHLV